VTVDSPHESKNAQEAVIGAVSVNRMKTQNKSPLPTGFSSVNSPQPLRFRPAAGLDVLLA